MLKSRYCIQTTGDVLWSAKKEHVAPAALFGPEKINPERTMKRIILILALIASVVLYVACEGETDPNLANSEEGEIIAETDGGEGSGDTGNAETGSEDATIATDASSDVVDIPEDLSVQGTVPSADGKTYLALSISDAPIDEAKAVNIAIRKIELIREDTGFIDFWDATSDVNEKEINLLDFRYGNSLMLDKQEIEPGIYGQIRLYLSAIPSKNTITLMDETVHELDINSGIINNGLKLVSGFEIKEGMQTSMTIDFDVRKSIVVKGGKKNPRYALKPTVKLIVNDVAAHIVATLNNITKTGELFYLYEAGFDVSNEANATKIDNNGTPDDPSDDEQIDMPYANNVGSASSVIDANDGLTKLVFPYTPYGTYSIYKYDQDKDTLHLIYADISVSALDEGIVTVFIDDILSPVNPSIVINNGDASTSSPEISVLISADDIAGVSGYYLSEDPTPPYKDNPGWIPVGPAMYLAQTVSFTLSSGSEEKTVYAWYRDESGNISDFTSDTIDLVEEVSSTWSQVAYFKASNADVGDKYGLDLSIKGDVCAVGARWEDSNQTTITNGTTGSSDNSASTAGAVYIYRSIDNAWNQEAYVKASNADGGDGFGKSIEIDSDTMAVSAWLEDSNQITIANGSTASSDNSATSSGAAYVFRKDINGWYQEAYIKAANADSGDNFGVELDLWNDTLAVSAYNEDSSQRSITNGTTASSDNSASTSGAVYVYRRNGNEWFQEAYIKASNADAGDMFGIDVSLEDNLLVVGSRYESSSQQYVTNGSTASNDNSVKSGAAYVFERDGSVWNQVAYIKAANGDDNDWFGFQVSVSGDTIAVAAPNEDSHETSVISGTTASSDNSAESAGAVYVYRKINGNWTQEAYIKASNAEEGDQFGITVKLKGDILVVGARHEDSGESSILYEGESSDDNSSLSAGAVYIFRRTENTWKQEAYIKASNVNYEDQFGERLSFDGDRIIVGAMYEDSNQTAVTNGPTANSDNSKDNSGAAYLFSP